MGRGGGDGADPGRLPATRPGTTSASRASTAHLLVPSQHGGIPGSAQGILTPRRDTETVPATGGADMKFLAIGAVVALVGVLAFIVLAPQPASPPTPASRPVPVPTAQTATAPQPTAPAGVAPSSAAASPGPSPPQGAVAEGRQRLADWLPEAKAAKDPRVSIAGTVEFGAGFVTGLPIGRNALLNERAKAKYENRPAEPLADATVEKELASKVQAMNMPLVRDTKWQEGFRAAFVYGWKLEEKASPPGTP